eukprot:UC1_evm3s165
MNTTASIATTANTGAATVSGNATTASFSAGGVPFPTDEYLDLLAPSSEEELGPDEDAIFEAEIVRAHQHPATGVLSAYSSTRETQERIRRAQLRKHIDALANEASRADKTVSTLEAQLRVGAEGRDRLSVQIEAKNTVIDGLRARADADSPFVASKVKRATIERRVIEEELAAHSAMTAATEEDLTEARLAAIEAARRLAEFDAHDRELRVEEARAAKEAAIIARLKDNKRTEMTEARARRRRAQESQRARMRATIAAQKERDEASAVAAQSRTRAYVHAMQVKEAKEAEAAMRAEQARRDKIARGLAAIEQVKERVADKDMKAIRRKRERQEARRIKHEAERAAILAQGGNPDAIFRIREQKRKTAAQQAKAAVARAKREEEIAARLAREKQLSMAAAASRRTPTVASSARRRVASGKSSNGSSSSFNKNNKNKNNSQQQRPSSRRGRGSSSSDRSSARPGGERSEVAAVNVPLLRNKIMSSVALSDLEPRADVAAAASADAIESTPAIVAASSVADFGEDILAGLDLGESEDENSTTAGVGGSVVSSVGSGIVGDNLGVGSDNGDLVVEHAFGGLWDEEWSAETEGGRVTAAVDTVTSYTPEGNMAPLAKPKSSLRQKTPTVADRRKMVAARERQIAGLVQKQVVAGREFKGDGFACKPSAVEFFDFEVGETYRARLVLTNVSYGVNSFTPREPQHDSLTYEYAPSGGLSPGLSTDLTVVFSPRLPEDVDTCILLLCRTGEIRIPVSCRTKRCCVSTTDTDIDFGDVAVGEVMTRIVTVHNTGALSTRWSLVPRVAEEETESTKKAVPKQEEGKEQQEKETEKKVEALTEPRVSVDGVSVKEEQAELSEIPPVTNGSMAVSESIASETNTDDEKAVATGETAVAASSTAALSTAADTAAAEIQSIDAISASSPTSSATVTATTAAATAEILTVSATDGLLPARGSITVELELRATSVGSCSSTFDLVFSDFDTPNICVHAAANVTEVPVFVAQDEVDLRICPHGGTFAAPVNVCNTLRGGAPYKVRFRVPSVAAPYLTIVPRGGAVAPGKTLESRVVLKPVAGLLEALAAEEGMADLKTGRITIPITMRAAGQTMPSGFILRAHVTPSDVTASVNELDFGAVSVYEAAAVTFKLTNTSALPQEYALLGLPSYVSAAPGNGTGTLLPFETLECSLALAPPLDPYDNADCELQFTVTLRWGGAPGTRRIKCRALAIVPPARLSASEVSFAPTVGGDISGHTLTLFNSSEKPATFAVQVPPDCPVDVSPAVFTLAGDTSIPLHLRFAPAIAAEPKGWRARLEAAKVADAKAASESSVAIGTSVTIEAADTKIDTKNGANVKKDKEEEEKGTGGAGDAAGGVSSEQSTAIAAEEAAAAAAETTTSVLRERLEQLAALPTSTTDAVITVLRRNLDGNSPSSFRQRDTLRLHLSLPVRAPTLAVVSGDLSPALDFGLVPTCKRVVRTLTIRNIGSSSVALRASALDTASYFTLVRCMRSVRPGADIEIVVAFYAEQEGHFFEFLEIGCAAQTLRLSLSAQGIEPRLSMELKNSDNVEGTAPPRTKKIPVGSRDDERNKTEATVAVKSASQPPAAGTSTGIELDFGDTRTLETIKRTLVLHNPSPFPLGFLGTWRSQTMRPPLSPPASYTVDLKTGRPLVVRKGAVGDQNASGTPVFSLEPPRATVPAGGSIEVTVRLEAETPSEYLSDILELEYASGRRCVLPVRARAWARNVFLAGADEMRLSGAADVLLPGAAPGAATAAAAAANPVRACICLQYSRSTIGIGGCVARSVVLGTLSSTAADTAASGGGGGTVKGKVKGLDVKVEPLVKSAMAQGFNVTGAATEPKFSLEVGTKTNLEVSFAPPGEPIVGHSVSTEIRISVVGAPTWECVLNVVAVIVE